MKKQVNLIITGGIAASKSIELYNLLKQDFDVKVIVTKNAKKFVKLDDLDYIDDIFDRDFYDSHHYGDHIKIAFKSTLNVVYPASYNFIGKIANGLSDDIASLIFAVSNYNTILFPSMNSNMYLNPILKKNKELLLYTGNIHWVEPKYGKLASGHEGIGRVLEPFEAFKMVKDLSSEFNNLKDKNILLNFGKTRSYIDKVRYITNTSSGKMGLELKKLLKTNSKRLKTVYGDTITPLNQDNNNFYVKTNDEMLEKMLENYETSDVVICSAALYDFEIENYVDQKIEKRNMNEEQMTIKLTGSIDVLKELGKLKTYQYLIGFSLANDFDLNKAWAKIKEKNLDMLIVNLSSAMESDTNKIKILITKNKEVINFDSNTKDKVALNILQTINDNLN